MRLLNFIILNIFLLGGLTLSTCNQAKAGELPQNQKVKALQTEIKSKISFPDALVDKDIYEKVTVEFRVKSDKTLEVIKVSSNNETLTEHVKKALSEIKVSETEGLMESTYQIGLIFEN